MEKFHWKRIGSWQKDSCTTKTIRNIHTESGREGREAIRSEPLPLGGDSEEKGDNTGGDLPWGVNGSGHILGALVLGSDKGKRSPLGWLEGQWDQQENWKALTSRVRSTHALACSQSRAERADWKQLERLPGFPLLSQCMPQPEPGEHSSPAYITLQLHSGARAATSKENAWLWNKQAAKTQSGVWVGWGQPLLALTQAAHWKWSRSLSATGPPQPIPQYTLRACTGPISPAAWLNIRVGVAETEGSDSCEGQRILRPQAEFK